MTNQDGSAPEFGECLARWHAQVAADDSIDAARAMLALTHHEPGREQWQRTLTAHTRARTALSQLAVTCLGHVGRLDGEVLPEVVERLTELLDDPELGGTAEDALGDIESFHR